MSGEAYCEFSWPIFRPISRLPDMTSNVRGSVSQIVSMEENMIVRQNRRLGILLAVGLASYGLAGCSSSTGGGPGTGGTSSGGSGTGSGGASGTGGTQGSGGNTASGGTVGSGGAPGT